MKKNHFVSLPKAEKLLYIVAVSGGPDSTFLLYKMRNLGYEIVAAHLNYRKRYDSFCDEELVVKHCKKLSVRLFTTRVENYEKGNFQAIARNLRYNFFAQVAERLASEGFSVGGVVIAHNFEDLLETYQLQKERKSLVGYWGLPFRSQFNKWSVLRPIISFRKELITRSLLESKIEYSSDYTNSSGIYRRNVIRRGVFALAEKEKSFLSEQIKKENVLLLRNTREVNRKIRTLFTDGTLAVGSKEWLLSNLEVKQRIVYILLSSFLGGKFFSRRKKIVLEICRQLQSRKQRLAINIGNELVITKSGKIVIFTKKREENYNKEEEVPVKRLFD